METMEGASFECATNKRGERNIIVKEIRNGVQNPFGALLNHLRE